MTTTYNQAGYVYNQIGVIYNQTAVQRTATGTGLGDSTATSNFFTILTQTATGSGTGTSNNTIVLGILRTGYGAGGATAGDTADWNINPVRTATGSGTSSFDATGLHIAPRTASGSGDGTSTTLRLHVAPRTATGSGEGTQTASRLVKTIRTASGEGTGAESALRIVGALRTADGSGIGDYVPSDWVKSHIFRVPITEGYPFAVRLSEAPADRLFAFAPQGARAKNLYRLTDGSYTTTNSPKPPMVNTSLLFHCGLPFSVASCCDNTPRRSAAETQLVSGIACCDDNDCQLECISISSDAGQVRALLLVTPS